MSTSTAMKRNVQAAVRPALPKVLFIVGPTASGKTRLGVYLAKMFQGEIINADSRQLYTQIEIGTGKPVGERSEYRKFKTFMHRGIPHYLMGFLPPTEVFTSAQWRASAMKAVHGITARRHVPIVVGGTGLYINSIVDNLSFPEVEPHETFRKAYEEKPLRDLIALLLVMDPDAFDFVDIKNKRRVIRALEVITFSGKKFSALRKKGDPIVQPLMIGFRRTPEELNARIRVAVEKMITRGLVEEIRELIKQDIPLNAPALTAIGYKDFADYLSGRVTHEQAVERLKHQTVQYAKRQMTWFKRDPRIHWVEDEQEAEKLVKEWLEK